MVHWKINNNSWNQEGSKCCCDSLFNFYLIYFGTAHNIYYTKCNSDIKTVKLIESYKLLQVLSSLKCDK